MDIKELSEKLEALFEGLEGLNTFVLVHKPEDYGSKDVVFFRGGNLTQIGETMAAIESVNKDMNTIMTGFNEKSIQLMTGMTLEEAANMVMDIRKEPKKKS